MKNTLPKLVALKVSPWSERAKWALDHHAIAYDVVPHLPILGERRLRRMVGPGKTRATVPVLLAAGEVLSESWDIALYADRAGKGEKLIPRDQEGAIRTWTDLADTGMQAGRALVMAAMLANPQALDESAPPRAPSWMRPLLRPVARRAIGQLAKKYDLLVGRPEESRNAVRAVLDRLREGLGARSPFLLGAFGYADIAMATLIQGISPVADRFLALGPATRRAWTSDALAAEYRDLVAWRDALYESRRGKRAR